MKSQSKICMSPAETAEALGISKSMIYMLLRENKLPYVKVGKRYLIPISELEMWCKQNE